MTINFPPILPLRTGMPLDVKRPGAVVVFKPDKRGRLKVDRLVIPGKAIR